MKEMPRISPIERLLNERLLQNLRSASLYTEEFIKLEKEGIQESKRLVKEAADTTTACSKCFWTR